MLPCKPTQGLVVALLIGASTLGWADDKVTRVYLLKNAEVSNIERAINIAIRDPEHTRVIGGQGKRLVISDTADQQDAIAQLLPVLDQPITETSPDKIQMKMLMNAAKYLRQQKIAMRSTAQPVEKTPAAVRTPAIAGAAPASETLKPAKPYTSIYASDDAKLLQGPRVIADEAFFPSLSSLELKGIYKSNHGSPLALLSCDNLNYTARDGGLFQNNRSRLKNVSSQILKDRVVLIGPDHIPREIKFKSSL